MTRPEATFTKLMGTIEERKQSRPTHSYTTRLFNGGVEKIGAKVLEEAAETVEAAGEAERPGDEGDAGRQHLVCEAADLLYHLFVLLAHGGVTLDQVAAELARREGVSGLDEKASRGPASAGEHENTRGED